MATPETVSFVDRAKDAIFDSLAQILGLSGEDAEAGIRFSWPTGSGSEAFSATPTTDICYIRVSSDQKPANGYVNTSYEGIDDQSLRAQMDMHVTVRADYIFYGPNAHEHATRLYMMILAPAARMILAKAGMAPIPHSEIPNQLHELIDGRWYERYDAGIDFYMLVKYTETMEALIHAPSFVFGKNE